MPRTPRNGFASRGHRQVGERLVAADVQRAQRDPPAAERLGDRRVDRLLLRDVGCLRAVEEQELGADEPGPSAPHSAARRASSTEPTLAPTCDGDAVAGDGGCRGVSEGRAAGTGQVGRLCPEALLHRGEGSTTISPLPPSTARSVPPGMSSTSGPAPTTVGIPRARRRIALWAVGAPWASTTATTRVGSSSAASAGVRSSATSTPLGAATSRPTPSSSRSTASRTAAMSAARARR